MGDSISCRPFKAKRVDVKGNVKEKGNLLVCSHELQFVLDKPRGKQRIDKDVFPFETIKAFTCRGNVLTVLQLPGTPSDIICFDVKEAVVVKELMDQVAAKKRRPTPRMPSFDFGAGQSSAGGFYDMSPTAVRLQSVDFGSAWSGTNPFGGNLNMQENASYMDATKANLAGYSSAKTRKTTWSNSTTDSELSGPPSAELPGYDNIGFGAERKVQYAQVETRQPSSPMQDPFSPPPRPNIGKIPFMKAKSSPQFGYTGLDMPMMEALRELDITKSKKK